MKKQGSIFRHTAFIVAMILGLFSSAAKAQLGYGSSYPGGVLEYSLPLLTAVPPTYVGQPPDITTAYLWLDYLMRGSNESQIDNYINGLGYGDTLKFLAEMDYSVIDDNALSFYQWDESGWREVGRPPLSWTYKSCPGPGRIQLQNQIGWKFNDTGRTGFLLACDYISDVTVGDTAILFKNGSAIPHMILVNATINDQIKGKRIPACPMTITRRKGATPQDGGYATSIVTADTGSCVQFEYSPEWQRGIFTDDLRPFDEDNTDYLADSTGFWIKPGGEYIVFLYVEGVNKDSANGYFTIDPFWGVFGTQGAMYRVIGGHVVDPFDDFGLGGTNFTVTEWKTRLRARIYNILHP